MARCQAGHWRAARWAGAAESGILSIVQLGLPFSDPAPAGEAGLAPTRTTGLAPSAPTLEAEIAQIYFVRHRRARRYLLRVDHDGRVRVTIPRGGSRREADSFARRHTEWVARQRERLRRETTLPLDRRARQAQAQAQVELPSRLYGLAAQLGLSVRRVSIRNQRTRWGSCGRDGHICLNWRLVVMPPWVRDYIIIHELMHLERLDHSPAYWRLVAAACPAYRDARQWLRIHGPSLR
jgi:predicted metal-dependent hydrolase